RGKAQPPHPRPLSPEGRGEKRTPHAFHLPPRRAPSPSPRLPPGLRPPPLGERRRADRLRLSQRPTPPSPRTVGVAERRPGHAPQPAAPPVPRGLSPDAARNADRPRPDPDPAASGGADAGGVEACAAAPGAPGGAKAGPRGTFVMMARAFATLRFLLTAFL